MFVVLACIRAGIVQEPLVFKPLAQPLRPPRRILVICTRRIGDVLLSTALLRSLKHAWPQARIDVLTNAGSAAVLEGNPDIERLLLLPDRPGVGEFLRCAARIFRRYSLALSTLPNDRQHVLAFLSAPVRVNAVPPPVETSARWKRWLSDGWAMVNLSRHHAVTQYLLLADCLRIPRVAEVVPPRAAAPRLPLANAYAVVHPRPMYRYKEWPVQCWVALLRWLAGQGLQVVLTGGPGAEETAYVQGIAAAAALPDAALLNTAGQLRFAELAELIRGARLFVGPDTSVTHLAAATGAPTVALFGPSPPVSWGPWPNQFKLVVDSPWVMTSPLQHQGNVWIVQGITPCVPCLREGCDRHLQSRADCLDQLPAARVIAVAAQALTGTGASAAAAPAPEGVQGALQPARP
ncbi:MAG TPA: glycosyltransferase family 9 protein [Nevskiaceae bacterium]|nr:glycosyltransferase family 9 protein [Nevskiaceae bacterium]